MFFDEEDERSAVSSKRKKPLRKPDISTLSRKVKGKKKLGMDIAILIGRTRKGESL